jgi:MYXO-CTERM domain-containing protein
VKQTALIIVASFSYLAFSSAARAETPAPTLSPPTTSTDTAAAGAHGEETFFPGPGGGELESPGPPPLESTGLEDGPGSCKCSNTLGAGSKPGAAWLGLGLGLVALSRRRAGKTACGLLQK